MNRSSLRLSRLAVLPFAMALVLAGCAEDDAPSDAPAAADAGYPLTVTNCGHELTLDAAPERIVTIKSTSTELALALGLGDKIVGHAFPDGPVPEALTEAAADLTQISEKAPSQEVVLEAEPDLVLAGWESNLAADTAGERDVLAKLGVASYVAPSACQSADVPAKMTFDLLFDHLHEGGAVLGAPEQSDELVAEQRAQLEALDAIDEGTTAVWWSSGVDIPFVGAGTGAPQMVMEAAGLSNVADDVEGAWTSLGWEAIVEADPDVLVLVDSEWNKAETKIASLEANPVTARMQAVKEKRYLTIPFPASEAGVRSVQAVSDLVDQAADLGLVAGR